MLIKLIKYDLKYEFKSISIWALIVFILGFITEQEFIGTKTGNALLIVLLISFILSIIISNIMGITLATLRFKNNLFTEEGYLTNVLPTHKFTIVISKAIAASMCQLIIIVSSITSIFWIARTALKTINFNMKIEDVFSYLSSTSPVFKEIYLTYFTQITNEQVFYFILECAITFLIISIYLITINMIFYTCTSFEQVVKHFKKIVSIIIFVAICYFIYVFNSKYNAVYNYIGSMDIPTNWYNMNIINFSLNALATIGFNIIIIFILSVIINNVLNKFMDI